MPVEVMPFAKAYDDTRVMKKHLLLGNGFSIACVPEIFTYGSLYEQADFSATPEVKSIFSNLGTQDFELVINSLENGARILPAYRSDLQETITLMKQHSQAVKEVLIQTIAARHPHIPGHIESEKLASCRKFLAHFLAENNGKVYTLNYDLLLYWTLMHDVIGEEFKIDHCDGFGKDFDPITREVSDYVVWQGETKANEQNVYYLHGALHLFDRGSSLEKFTWRNSGTPLVDQARYALTNGKFPLFVAEGSSENKMKKITHSNYLYHAYKSFSATMNVEDSCLFTYGVSFGENDSHVLKKIGVGKVKYLYVGLYGNPEADYNQNIIKSAEFLKEYRSRFPLEVLYYDVSSAAVWA